MPASVSAALVAVDAISGYGALLPGLANGIMPTPAITTSRLITDTSTDEKT
jgi:hypothetical protein